MWFHKTGRFAVGDNGEPSIYIACAVHSEHLKLINCVNNTQDTRRQVRQLFLMSTQCKALNNLRVNAIHGHCCLRGPVRKSCNTQFRLGKSYTGIGKSYTGTPVSSASCHSINQASSVGSKIDLKCSVVGVGHGPSSNICCQHNYYK